MEKQTRQHIRYNVQDAINFVMLPVDDKGKESDIDDDSHGIAAKSKKGKRRIRRNLSFAAAIESLQSPTSSFLSSVQKAGKSTNTYRKELEQLIGVMMKMGIVKMPPYQNYWSQSARFAPIADVISHNRFKELRRFLHANNNSKKDEERDKDNKLFKVAPILEALKINCRKIEQEEFQSIDEQIVPAKTKFSGIRQYNPKKHQKWCFKNFVRAGESGFMHDFFFYAGAKSAGTTTCGAADVVKKLCETMPSKLNHKLFFNN
eukprot:gene927-234_t